MKEAIYSWIKCLAIFYILLTMLIHLVPTGKYQRYVRFFMGLLLIFMMSTPMLFQPLPAGGKKAAHS